MTHDYGMVLVSIGIVLVLLGGRKIVLWTGRYMVQATGPLFDHRWHGFPRVHRVKRISCTKEWFTGERIEVYCCGIRAESVRRRSKRVYCNVCGKTISEDPIGDFIYSSQGKDVRIA